MKSVLSSLLMLALLPPAFAQRKIDKGGIGPMDIPMVKVTGGSFDMGIDSATFDKRPARTVKLNDYYIGTYEVTQRQWEMVMEDNPSKCANCEECPVTNVSWNDVQEFIKKLNSKSGKKYRLPTEAEWEFAARGGVYEDLVKEGKAYRGGVNEFLIAEKGTRIPDKYKEGKRYAGRRGGPQSVAWYENNSGDRPHPVGRKQPNDIGIFDMSGNAEEWVSDFYAGSYGSDNTVENPQGPVGGISRVVRGGGYNSPAVELTVTYRKAYLPTAKSNSLGFRLVEEK
jgi:formylglycine-generating enzyme required for sulfatase activity